MSPFLKKVKSKIKKSHSKDFSNLPCSQYKLSQVSLFYTTNVLNNFFHGTADENTEMVLKARFTDQSDINYQHDDHRKTHGLGQHKQCSRKKKKISQKKDLRSCFEASFVFFLSLV